MSKLSAGIGGEECGKCEFDHRFKTLEANFSEFMQTNQFAEAVSSILGIVDRYTDHRINKAIKVAFQLQSDRLQNEAQAKNDDFINKLDENIQKIIKDNKSIHRSDEQRNLYKALVDAYECDKIILDTYGDTVTLKRRRNDADKDKEPSTGSDRGFKRRREGKEPESTSALKDKASKTTDKSTKGSKSDQKTASESASVEELMQTTQDLEEPSHQEFETATHRSIQPWKSDLAKQADSHASFNEMIDTHVDFSAFLMNRLKVDTLTLELLAVLTYELMKGSCKSLVELKFFLEEVYKATTDQLTKAADYGHIKWIEDLVPRTMWSQTLSTGSLLEMSTQNVESSLSPNFRLSNGTTTSTWIGSLKAEQYHFEERFAFNVSLRMFMRSIVIQRHVEDLQLGVKSYQKKLNLTELDTYRTDLKRKEAYTAYSNPRGFIYQNKDKQNRLMWIDELHKFSDSTLNDV
uniref:Uncharacterized protein n=1 Tax=Tanacetum cinerariifolium TaxID=118510 RepID=A0A6L2KCB2_TANCI|nr:hypothetical protein [Tanacetum cinerariifolium]